MYRRDLLAAAIGIPLFAVVRGARAQGTPLHTPSGEFLEALPRLMAQAGVPGASVTMFQGAELTWSDSFGTRTANGDQAVRAETVFEAASLTKPVVAYLAMLLVQDGVLDLNRPLDDYLAEPYAADDTGSTSITANHVMGHSTGYQNWRFNDTDALVTAWEPGTQFGYSGEGFYELQRVIESLTGRGLGALVEEWVFQPLGLTRSSLVWRQEYADQYALPHRRGGALAPTRTADLALRLHDRAAAIGTPLEEWRYEDLVEAFASIPETPSALPVFFTPNAAGSLMTTTSEYAQFASVAIGASAGPLEEAFRRQLFEPMTLVEESLWWGRGWGLEESSAGSWAWHWGDNPGYKNFVLTHLPSRSGIVVFTNGDNGRAIYERVIRGAGHDAAAFLWI